MQKPTVLISGVSGFIAKHCAVEMLKSGYGVRGTVRSLKRADEVRASIARHADVARLEFAQADLDNDAGWDAAVKVAALATVLMDSPIKPQEVERRGIREITPAMVNQAKAEKKRWK